MKTKVKTHIIQMTWKYGQGVLLQDPNRMLQSKHYLMQSDAIPWNA